MQPLDEPARRRVLSWSALLCAVPLCLAPLAARSSFELASERAAFAARFTAPPLQSTWAEKPVAVARDPFVPQGPAQAPADAPHGHDVVGLHVTQGQPIGYVAAAAPAAAATVTAVITGTSPRALIDAGGSTRVVGVGDSFSGSRIASIDASGVRLRNGVFLPISAGIP